MEPQGRHSCSTVTKIGIIDYARLTDSGVAGNHGVAVLAGTGTVSERTRGWVHNEKIIRQDKYIGGGKGKQIQLGRVPTIQDVEAELVYYVNDCLKGQSISQECIVE